MKAIYHVDEPEKWGLAATNLENHLEYCREQGLPCSLEIVANSAAVNALRREAAEQPLHARLEALHAEGVTVAACANALRAQKIGPGELCAFVRVVPAGVVELAQKQAEGYAYLKP